MKWYCPQILHDNSHLRFVIQGSNFDDNEKKTTGGRNGYGAKLANIFSKKFIVECLDTSHGLKFKQVWWNNMHQVDEPVIDTISSSEKKHGDYVKITFVVSINIRLARRVIGRYN